MLQRLLVPSLLSLLVLSPALQAQEQGAERRGNQRVGLWGGIGLGAGNLGCLESGCSNREWGFSGNARIGGTISPSVRLAVGTNGYYKEENGATLQGGAVTAQVLLYPKAGDFFVIAGAGLGLFEGKAGQYSDTETGAGFLIGIGWDLSINRTGSLALTPFFNWVPTTVGGTIDFLQFGLGLTFN